MTAAGLLRRMAAVGYDILVVIALLMAAEFVYLQVTDGMQLPADALVHRVYLAVVPLAFFVGFWHRGGQTLGMRAWRIKVVSIGGGEPRLQQLLLRAATALMSWLPAGLGFWWALVDSEKLTWHDRLSGTRLVRLNAPGQAPPG